MNDYTLNNKWVLWFHSLKNPNWDNKSYIKVIEIKTLLDFKLLNDVLRINHLQNGMFFLMKNDIFPTWEDPKNRLGGCISFKYDNNILKEWLKILLLCITDNLSNKRNINDINGLSISPKKEFNIIKVWIKDDSKDHKKIIKSYEPFITLDKSIYKKHELSY
uniref:Eukaryotic translation initiation factor 4E n=1 Tax=viral metagenome TaxID=1070528 RepID=A0A6C0C4S1_9ZZZZ